MSTHIDRLPTQAACKRSQLTLVFTIVAVVMTLISCIQPSPVQSPATNQPTGHGLWPSPALGVVADESMKVLNVDPGSAAEKAGIQAGDVLVAVEGVSFAKETEKAENIIQELPPEGEAAYEAFAKGEEWQGNIKHLQVQRNGEIIEIEVMPAPPVWDPEAPPTPAYPPLLYF